MSAPDYRLAPWLWHPLGSSWVIIIAVIRRIAGIVDDCNLIWATYDSLVTEQEPPSALTLSVLMVRSIFQP